jgi:cupin fold WbuC family metalloprotein
MSDALPNLQGGVVSLDASTIAQGLAASRASSRRRVILPLQRTQEARVQRLANFLQPGTYIRPHCHPEPHASESVCLIQGKLEVLRFSESGEILDRWMLEEKGTRVIDIEPGVWHGMLVHQEDTVVFEAKRGPYDAARDKTFAPWAPEEGSDTVEGFLNTLL